MATLHHASSDWILGSEQVKSDTKPLPPPYRHWLSIVRIEGTKNKPDTGNRRRHVMEGHQRSRSWAHFSLLTFTQTSCNFNERRKKFHFYDSSANFGTICRRRVTLICLLLTSAVHSLHPHTNRYELIYTSTRGREEKKIVDMISLETVRSRRLT